MRKHQLAQEKRRDCPVSRKHGAFRCLPNMSPASKALTCPLIKNAVPCSRVQEAVCVPPSTRQRAMVRDVAAAAYRAAASGSCITNGICAMAPHPPREQGHAQYAAHGRHGPLSCVGLAVTIACRPTDAHRPPGVAITYGFWRTMSQSGKTNISCRGRYQIPKRGIKMRGARAAELAKLPLFSGHPSFCQESGIRLTDLAPLPPSHPP